MSRLGYRRYGAQGGDFGALISPEVGRADPDHVLGVHVNALVTMSTGDPAEIAELTDAERERLAGLRRWHTERPGYAAIQSTRPQTLAYALADSPAGQLPSSARPRGGHFAALQAPDLLVGDIREFFCGLR